jgi:outer membrane protein assembly factor BamB
MITFRQQFLWIILFSFFISGCNSLWEKDNTLPPSPLVQFAPTISPRQLWDNRVSFNLNHDHLKLSPALTDNTVVTVDAGGTITVVDRFTGKTRWKPFINAAVSTGPAVHDDLIIIGTSNGVVIALGQAERKELWRVTVNNEILATPVISGNLVLIKSIDGTVTALSTKDGHFLWSHAQTEPNLILRGASAPQVAQGAVIVGYASGKVVKLSLQTGRELWSQNVTLPEGAFAIQRMIDVDADPVIAGNRVFVATYQGKVAALDFSNGKILWDYELSSYAGIAVDKANVYISDAKSEVLALNRDSGRLVWKQRQLQARNITGPALMSDYLVVGDGQGVLHWLSKQDGSFAGRVFSGTRIQANPVAQENMVYAITQDGYLFAYVLH